MPGSEREEELGGASPQELWRLYLERQARFGRAARALERRRGKNRLHVPAEEAQVERAGPKQRMIVGPELGFNVHNFHVFTSGRAGGSERYHTHGDALKYYVSGAGYELVGDERFEVKAGDFCHVPGNTWHGTENPHPEPLVFLAAQQFPGTCRQVATPFVHLQAPNEPPEVQDLSGQALDRLEPWPLYLWYLEEQMAFGRAALELQRRRGERRLHLRAGDARLAERGPGRHNVVSPELGFDIYAFHLYAEHVPGMATGERRETSVEAVRYYLSGAGEERIDGATLHVKAGDFAFVPAGSRHETRNPYREPLRLICWEQIPGTYLQIGAPELPGD